MGGAGKSVPLHVLEEAGVAGGAVLVEVELQPADLSDVLFLPPPGSGPDRVDAKVDVIVPRIQVPQPGQVLWRRRLGEGGHALLGVAGRARDGKDRDAILGGIGEHAVNELGRLIFFHCRSSSAGKALEAFLKAHAGDGVSPGSSPPIASLSWPPTARPTSPCSATAITCTRPPNQIPIPAPLAPLRLFLPGRMAHQRLPGPPRPSRGLSLPPGIEFQR